MIPETAGALVALLALVAPGMIFRTVWEQRRSQRRDSAAVEASIIALTSLLFTATSITLLWAVSLTWPDAPLPNLASWLARGNTYVASEFGTVAFGTAMEVLLACLLAGLVAWLMGRGRTSQFLTDPVYYTVFRNYPPRAATPNPQPRRTSRLRRESVEHSWPYVHAVLDNGTEYWGHQRAHDEAPGNSSKSMVLTGQQLARRVPGAGIEQIGSVYDVLVLDSESVRSLEVVYQYASNKQLVGMRTTKTDPGRVMTRRPEPLGNVELEPAVFAPVVPASPAPPLPARPTDGGSRRRGRMFSITALALGAAAGYLGGRWRRPTY